MAWMIVWMIVMTLIYLQIMRCQTACNVAAVSVKFTRSYTANEDKTPQNPVIGDGAHRVAGLLFASSSSAGFSRRKDHRASRLSQRRQPELRALPAAELHDGSPVAGYLCLRPRRARSAPS